MTITCPVCWRTAQASDDTGRVARHYDSIGHTCVMSGHHMPTEIIERRAA
ncbi:MAG: hypothetical protein WAX14_18595 [Rhodococcus sp. (in: high G+C Gram-positive bacteria)]